MVANSSTESILVETRGFVGLYTSTLERKGYRPIVIDAYRGAVEHFLAWYSPDADCVEIGEASIQRFLAEHLPSCDCSGRVQRGKVIAQAALRHFLAIIRTPALYHQCHRPAQISSTPNCMTIVTTPTASAGWLLRL